MKVKKIILAIVSALILSIVAFGQTAYASDMPDVSVKLVSLTDENYKNNKEYQYGFFNAGQTNGVIINRIGQTNGTGYDRIYDAYCAWANRGFNNTSSRPTSVYETGESAEIDTYKAIYDMNDSTDKNKIVSNNILQNTTISGESSYDIILQLVDLFYLEEDTFTTYQENTLKNAIDSFEVLSTKYSEYKADGKLLTADEVRAVQQVALWYITNYNDQIGTSEIKYKDLISKRDLLYVRDKSNTTENSYSEVEDEKNEQARALLSYLINTAISNVGNSTDTTVYLYTNGSGITNTQPIIMIKREKKDFDLALRKFITKINNTAVTTSREPDTSSNEDLTGTGLKSGEKTAKKEHVKNALGVAKGDKVLYTIRIYNEGEVAGYAETVTDYLPTGLDFIPKDQSTINNNNGWNYNSETRKVTTKKLAHDEIDAANRDWSKLDDKDSNGKPIYYRDLEIECLVNNDATSSNLKNIAEITASHGKNGEKDVDSDVNSIKSYPSTYKGTHETTGRGMEDDDDFENLKLKEFDLALRKYISRVRKDEDNLTVLQEFEESGDRKPNVDTSKLNNNGVTTAEYKHRKDPVVVETGNVIDYKLVIYNEGSIAGRPTKVIDQLPEGVALITSGEVTSQFKKNVYTISSSENKVTLTMKDTSTNDIDAYTKGAPDRDVILLQCKVTENPDQTKKKVFTNIAWIAEHKSGDGTYTYTDRDSNRTTDKITPKMPTSLVTEMPDVGYTNEDDNDLSDQTHYFEGQEDDDDFEKIALNPKKFDLALRKFITKINNTPVTPSREPQITGKTIVEDTTAEKTHSKTPLKVSKGDTVVYKIRIYNEGDIAGTATEVADYLPEGLEFVTPGNGEGQSKINLENGWSNPDSTGKITTDKLKGEVIQPASQVWKKLKETDYYRDLYVECKVKDTATKNNLKNVAEITKDSNGNDADSVPGKNGNKNTPRSNDYGTPSTSTKGRGYEDDDDYEDLRLEELDLALRKFITRVATNKEMDGATTYKRAPLDETSNKEVSPSDITKLYNEEITTAEYKHQKNPLAVNIGDFVEYTLRVYNEGSMNGYAKEITDYLPPYLKYVECEANTEYGWVPDEKNPRIVRTKYLSSTDKMLSAVTATTLDSEEVKIICQVVENTPAEVVQTNIAEISLYGDKSGKDLTVDRDSETIDDEAHNINGKVDLPDDEILPDYKGHEENKADLSDINYYYKGQQDEDDFEKIYVRKFDLALRKFITKVESQDGKNRYTQSDYDERVPQVSEESFEKFKNGKTTTLEYKHSKEPMYTVKDDEVTYTLRIFNEGLYDGYASFITDDIPEGLEFIIDNDTNKEYRWEIYGEPEEGKTYSEADKVELNINESSDKKTTYVKLEKNPENVKKAKIIRTDYLSKEQGEERMKEGDTVNPSLIKAFDTTKELSDTNPDYKDVKVAFKVTEDYGSDRILINYAQISDDQDEEGNPVTDIDSTPDRWIKDEDDQDIEKLKVPQFDLALRKWVTQSIVTENGKTTVKETGHQPFDDPEEIVKVELHRKNLSNVTVKFRYSIRVYNDGYDKETGVALPGHIAGYAKEVKDHIPEGLKFVAEDNPDWKDEGNNIITTRKLENTLLQPGEYADVDVVLTWINGNDNLGLKVNYAEISEDYNDWGVPDKDSTPDNMKERHEDDDDDAPVMLSVSTGVEATYIILGLTVLITIAGGVVLIKKFVM